MYSSSPSSYLGLLRRQINHIIESSARFISHFNVSYRDAPVHTLLAVCMLIPSNRNENRMVGYEFRKRTRLCIILLPRVQMNRLTTKVRLSFISYHLDAQLVHRPRVSTRWVI
jgi:hypothetical protein